MLKFIIEGVSVRSENSEQEKKNSHLKRVDIELFNARDRSVDENQTYTEL